MSDMGDDFRYWREQKKKNRRENGIPCEDCITFLPKANPSILLPGQKCKMHDFRAPRKKDD